MPHFVFQFEVDVGREEAVSLESSRVLAAVCIPVTHVASPGFTYSETRTVSVVN